MAYWIAGQSPHAKHFMCDTEADVANLPTTVNRGVPQDDVDDTNTYTVQAGSTAKVIATGDKYILQSDIDTWIKQPASGGGGGGGEAVPDTEASPLLLSTMECSPPTSPVCPVNSGGGGAELSGTTSNADWRRAASSARCFAAAAASASASFFLSGGLRPVGLRLL